LIKKTTIHRKFSLSCIFVFFCLLCKYSVFVCIKRVYLCSLGVFEVDTLFLQRLFSFLSSPWNNTISSSISVRHYIILIDLFFLPGIRLIVQGNSHGEKSTTHAEVIDVFPFFLYANLFWNPKLVFIVSFVRKGAQCSINNK
jgi:hypothetical protein